MCTDLQKMLMMLLNENENGLQMRSNVLKTPQTFLFGNKFVQLNIDDCLGYLQDIDSILLKMESTSEMNSLTEFTKILKYSGFLSHKLNSLFD